MSRQSSVSGEAALTRLIHDLLQAQMERVLAGGGWFTEDETLFAALQPILIEVARREVEELLRKHEVPRPYLGQALGGPVHGHVYSGT